jgi:hypothetical protein
MAKKFDWNTIIIIFFIVLGIRLYFAFQTPYFSDAESYYSLRQVEYITAHGVPDLTNSYSSTDDFEVVSPFFYYLLAFFNLFLPLNIVGKLIPNILASTIIIFVYLISNQITKNNYVARITAILSIFVPIFFIETFNSVNPFSLIIPVFLALIYCFININKNKEFVFFYVWLIFLFSITHISVYIFIFGLFIYFIILKIEKIKIDKREIEILLFSVFLVFWSQFILFKQAFLSYGPSFLISNISAQYSFQTFLDVNIFEGLFKVGFFMLLVGFYVFYQYSFVEKKKNLYLLFSFIILLVLFYWFEFIPLNFLLIFSSIIFYLLFSQFFKNFLIYINKMRVVRYEKFFLAAIILLFIITTVVPTFYYIDKKLENTYTDDEINVLKWLNENSSMDSVILSTYIEGDLIAHIAKRKNVIDNNILFSRNIEQRLEDIEEIYTTSFFVNGQKLLNKYDIDYILVSPRIFDYYDVNNFKLADNIDCIRPVYKQGDVILYKSSCEVGFD